MKFGIFYAHQIPRPWSGDHERKFFNDALEQAEIADRIGIDYLWAQEHHFLEEYSHSSAPEVFLAACSQRTRTIRLGHGIVLMPPAYNHPARVAERIATLDLISNGRVDWGTGESSSRLELEAFGIDYVDKRAMWMEAVREAVRMVGMEPYPGFDGQYFSMPCRNIVPKPLQKPHPPLWLACANRETMKLAARLGMGALTFAFMDAREAKFWVDEYYDTFRTHCTPIGVEPNPSVAMLAGFMCHEDEAIAQQRGLDGLRYFAYGLNHYRTGTHVPGRLELWEEFKKLPPFIMAGTGGISSPAKVLDYFATFEAAGVDQLILLQQSGNYLHEHVCESLELFGSKVLPVFKDRHDALDRSKREALAPYLDRARANAVAIEPMREVPPVESHQALMTQANVDHTRMSGNRSMNATALWKLHVAGEHPTK
jgi:alkanesulfonate monooxygenase SsuD/methylene tetrahydromethanopterin reductase-like flavin-dependent oxidoreductase (luciferase family)